MESQRQVTKESVFDKVFFLSRWFNLWIIPVFNKGWKNTITVKDVFGNAWSENPENLGSKLER
jgi:hypothetical protein